MFSDLWPRCHLRRILSSSDPAFLLLGILPAKTKLFSAPSSSSKLKFNTKYPTFLEIEPLSSMSNKSKRSCISRICFGFSRISVNSFFAPSVSCCWSNSTLKSHKRWFTERFARFFNKSKRWWNVNLCCRGHLPENWVFRLWPFSRFGLLTINYFLQCLASSSKKKFFKKSKT